MCEAENLVQEPALPQELIDYILEIVVEEWHSLLPTKRKDHETSIAVGRCMLVSHTFLTSTRRYLFAHVSTHERPKLVGPSTASIVSSDNVTARMDELLKLLKKDPLLDNHPLVAHIRSIKIEMDPLSHKNAEKLRQDNSHRWLKPDSGTLDWNTRRMNMREVLRILPNLNAFALQFTTPISGHGLHVGLALAVERLCESPLLTSLHFENINNFPIDIFASCTNLRQLRLVNIHTGDPDYVLDSDSPRSAKYALTLLCPTWNQRSLQHLEALDTELSGDVFVAINPKNSKKKGVPVYFSGLKTLKIGVQGHSGPDSLREVDLMRGAAHKLESLTIRGIGFDVSCNRFPGQISLGEFKVLRTLHIKAAPLSSLFRHMPRGLDPFLGLQVESPTSIETIIFEFTTTSVIQDPSDLGVLPSDIDPFWATIDNHLNDKIQYPCLKKVKFQLSFLYRRPFGMFKAPKNESEEEGKDGKDKGLASLLELADRIFPKVAHSERIKYEVDVDLVDTQNE